MNWASEVAAHWAVKAADGAAGPAIKSTNGTTHRAAWIATWVTAGPGRIRRVVAARRRPAMPIVATMSPSVARFSFVGRKQRYGENSQAEQRYEQQFLSRHLRVSRKGVKSGRFEVATCC